MCVLSEMGSCASVQKDQPSAVKLRPSSRQKNDKLLIAGGDPTVADVPHESNPICNVHDFDNEEETFFDSQPWLESDCEDDFSSVYCDFIPSRGSTPVHTSHSVDKKKLSDLFKQSLEALDEQNSANINAAQSKLEVSNVVVQPKSTDEVPGLLGAKRIRRSSSAVLRADDKAAKSCLPKLISSRSFSERKKGMSPTRRVGVRRFCASYEVKA